MISVAPCSRQQSAVAVEQDQGRVKLNLERFLDGTVSVFACEKHGVVDSEFLDRLGRGRAAILERRTLFTGDADHLKPISTHLGLEFGQVRDRRSAGLTPTSPEIEQNHVGAQVVERHHLSVEVGELKINQPALAGIKAAHGFLDGGIDRRPRSAQ